MNAVPADPYVRNESGEAIGHYGSEPLNGGAGSMRVGQKFTTEWCGREFQGEVVGFESQGTNDRHRVIVLYTH